PSSPVLDASWGTSGIIDLKSAAFSLGSNTFVNGLTIGPDGTVFAAGGVNATDRGDAVFEISADGLSLMHTANVSGAMDDVILDGKLFVTQYLGPNSSIAVLNESDLSTVATITDSPKGPYNNVNPDAAGYDAGYSGIDIGPDGKVYVAEQIYNNDGLFHDRILVSSPLAAPSFTSGASAAFALNSANTFTVATTGSPTAALTETGALPTGVTFVDNLDGTATLAGTPSTAGVFHFTITASNYLAATPQSFTLTVQQAPAITSAATTTFAASAPGAFTVTTTGTPAATLTETGPLPSGVTFVDNGDGTATLSGTAAFGSQGDYPFSIKASNGVAPDATQNFTLTILAASGQSAELTSPSSTTFTEGSAGAMTITSTGTPTPSLTETGALPAGVTFVDHGNGTASLSGTPAAGTSGVFTFTITAHNGVGPDATQNFTLTVVAPSANSGFYLAGVPGDGTPQTFVHSLYRELLGREPDAPGASFWDAYLQQHNNAGGRRQVMASFLNSAEYKTHYVTVLYEVFLGRAPEATGLPFWTGKMGSPGTPGAHGGSADEKFIFSDIVGSDEAYLRAGNTPESFVNALYQELLGRTPEANGKAYWIAQFQARPEDRDGVVRDFMSTFEAEHRLLNTFYPAPGGTAAHPLPAPGTAVPPGSPGLAIVTGDGWENLYLEGDPATANDAFFAQLDAGVGWDDLQIQMLTSEQFYSNSNRPVTL
ncbi:MAG TPA: DUF4214 domain-containing protein, partial [Pirellulales bacterium]|nr:DUF4214 domain-containing protein [Pirellulales bacterium]